MTNSIFETIKNNITRLFIFYVPEILYDFIQDSIYRDIVPKQDINTVAFMDRDRKTSVAPARFQKYTLLEKSSIFEENIFALLDAKETLSKAQFEHLLKKYWEHLDSYTTLSQWMHDNIHECIHLPSESIVELFAIQKQLFENHRNLVIEKYGNPISNERIRLFKERMEKQMDSPNFKVTVPILLAPTPPIKKSPEPRKKKKELITDEEVDKMLLETVFNVLY
ncbi:hypothetical protein [Mangrovimonas sp. DI 80]|uniref:hypothetical protein n=1 Tax=Mangrovimonas sp. DI 80 TaxID=1779330 RepID=UPI00097806C9|nr:hypothetical protein [Mangrovimonas sp. DI 80]OMP29939.1 hypothetical protein BKM32_15155 [Mangrovimonas sp. DI 80]